MERIKVESSNISSIGYDEQNQILEVEFYDFRVFQYIGVPLEVYTNLMEAPSKGQFFARAIRSKYKYRRIAGDRQ